MKDFLYFAIVFGLVFSLGFIVAHIEPSISGQIIAQTKVIPNSEQDIINNCKNLNLLKTSECLKENIQTFYRYDYTDGEIIRDFNDLKEHGGDCRDYSVLYNKLEEELGFSGQNIHIYKNETVDHMINIISNNNGYCVLDMINDINCVEY